MHVTKLIPIQLYDTKIQFIITKDARKYVNNLYKKHNIKNVYKDNIAGIMFTMDLNLYRIIIDENYLSHNTVQHESFHAVMAITSDRAIYEEEQRAWLAGYIGQEIYNFLKTKNIELI